MVEQNNQKNENASVLMDENEAAKFLLISRRKLQSLRYNKAGPKYHKIGSSIIYNYQDILQFLESVKRK